MRIEFVDATVVNEKICMGGCASLSNLWSLDMPSSTPYPIKLFYSTCVHSVIQIQQIYNSALKVCKNKKYSTHLHFKRMNSAALNKTFIPLKMHNAFHHAHIKPLKLGSVTREKTKTQTDK